MDGQVKVIEACEVDGGKGSTDERGWKKSWSHMEASHTRGWAREQYIADSPSDPSDAAEPTCLPLPPSCLLAEYGSEALSSLSKPSQTSHLSPAVAATKLAMF